jgi:hypothetical protein
MNMGYKALVGFAPFAAFALIEKLAGIMPGLIAGFAVSLALVLWEGVRHHAFNMLEVGSGVIFGGLVLIALRDHPSWPIWQVRLYVDGGLAIVIFAGIILGYPFTLQHARANAWVDVANSPDFWRHNALLSGVWGAAFVGLASVDFYMITVPGAPDRRGIIATLIILGAAAKFTQSHVKKIRSGGRPA